MKRDGQLYESLQKLFLMLRSHPPHVFEDLMRLEETFVVEQLYSVGQVRTLHITF